MAARATINNLGGVASEPNRPRSGKVSVDSGHKPVSGRTSLVETGRWKMSTIWKCRLTVRVSTYVLF